MPENIYEIIALGARYWFALLGVLIVWRSFRWLRRDRREKHRRLKQLPDAGMIGEMVVLEGGEELPVGESLPVPREGILGYVRGCDVVVPAEGVARQHCDFSFRNGDGLLIYPRHGCFAAVDGVEITSRKCARQHPMHHGSRLEVGEAVLRLRVFMGLETERQAQMLPDEEPQPEAHESPEHWQESPVIYHQVPAQWQEPLPPYDPQQGYPPPRFPYGQGMQPLPPMEGYPPAEDCPPTNPPTAQPYPPAEDEAPRGKAVTKRRWLGRRKRHE